MGENHYHIGEELNPYNYRYSMRLSHLPLSECKANKLFFLLPP